MPEPRAEVAASSIVSTVSVGWQTDPLTITPERHSTMILGVPIRTVPVRSIPAGRRIVRSANTVASKPLMPLESWMNIDTRSCEPTDPVIVAGAEEQPESPSGRMQTTPEEAACAGVESAAAANTVPINNRIDVKATGVFFK